MNTTNERYKLNKELAQMLKGGVIMDVTTPEQAKIAEAAGACAVMALERIPADIRAAGGVARMSDPKMIRGIQEAVSIPDYFVLFQRLTLHDRDVGSDGIVHVDAWKYIRVRVSLVEHIDQTGTEVLVRVYGGPQVSSIREQGAD